jgi:hypothetical protein
MGEKIYKAYLEGQDPDELLRALGRPEGRISGGGVLGVIEDFCRLRRVELHVPDGIR